MENCRTKCGQIWRPNLADLLDIREEGTVKSGELTGQQPSSKDTSSERARWIINNNERFWKIKAQVMTKQWGQTFAKAHA